MFTPEEIVKIIQNSPVIQTVHRLSEERGAEIFLVGGTVRDLLIGVPSIVDFDFALSNDPLTFAQALAGSLEGSLVWLHGQFGQYRVVKRVNKDTVTIDLSRYKGMNIQEDLRQRDFAINSVAIDVSEIFRNGELRMIDPLNGREDLQKRTVRLSSPHSLREDPVRIMRGVRIARKYQFSLDENLSLSMKEHRNLLAGAAPERVRTELFRIFDSRGIYDSLVLLEQLGILAVLMPEVMNFREYRQGEPHRYDLWEHSLRAAQRVETILEEIDQIRPASSPFMKEHFSGLIEGEVSRSALLKFGAFLHDMGKLLTRTVEGGRTRFFEHEHEGTRINREIARRFRLGRKAQRYVEIVTKNHMRILNLTSAPRTTQRAMHRFFRELEDTGIDILIFSLADAWATGKGIEDKDEYGRIASIVDCFLEYYFTEFTRQPVLPLLTGSDIMKIFHVQEGKRVGEMLEMVREAEVKGEIGTREEAVSFLKRSIS